MADEKGIKFYLCQTEEGPQLEHLQAEAKKRDPNFETIHVDTTKQPLMDRLNALMRRAHDAEQGPVTVAVPAPRPAAPTQDERLSRSYDQTGFEQFIWDIPDEEGHRLDTLEAIIKERRGEIAGEKREPAPAPKPAKKQWGKKK